MPNPKLWRVVLPYLLQPTPAPLSAPPRYDIRQNDLVSLLRTCKLFQEIATPLIYTHIITDDLALLLQVENLPSRLPYFVHTKTLRIEYLAKAQGSPYHELCSENMWERREAWEDCGPTNARRLEIQEGEARREVKELTRCFDTTTRSLSTIFPNLETIMVASIYGSDGRVWDPLFESEVLAEGEKTPLIACGRKFADFVEGGYVRHICFRDIEGPLFLPHTNLSTDKTPHTTVHFNRMEGTNLSLRFGSPQRWLFDGSLTNDDWSGVLELMGRGFKLLRGLRVHVPFWATPLDIRICCSTSWSARSRFDANHILFSPSMVRRNEFHIGNLSPATQTARAEKLQKAVRDYFAKQPNGKPLPGHVRDDIRWESCVKTDPCAACGAGPPP